MVKELFFKSSADDVKIALLEDKELVEYHTELIDASLRVGDILMASVSRILPGVNAAFLNIGQKKDGFLHQNDLGEHIYCWNNLIKASRSSKKLSYFPNDYYKENNKNQKIKINEFLKPGWRLPVQIIKEPIANKGPKMSCNISIPGRFLILAPFGNEIYFSRNIRKISERKRIKKILSEVKPERFGIIVRTASEGVKENDLKADLKNLLEKWKQLIDNIAKPKPNKILLKEVGKVTGIIRDLLNDNFNNIFVDNENIYHDIKNLIKKYSPDQEKIVKLYKGEVSIFDKYGINRQINNSFGKKVPIPGGSYLLIEHTEALHVIDVNSGNLSRVDKEGKTNLAYAVNMAASKEIIRQIRLRDLGGIIVVDFIDMEQAGQRKELFEFMKKGMHADKAKHKILPPSKFGLVQITRKRTKPENLVENVEKCPVCNGSGEVKNVVSLIDEIENNLKYLILDLKKNHIVLNVHPYYAAFLKKGLFNFVFQWFFKYKKWIKIKEDDNLHLMQYSFSSNKTNEVYLNS